MLWALAAVAWAGGAPCLTAEAWRGELRTALDAWAALDEATFVAAVARARQGVPCLAEPLEPPDAVAWHLVEAASAWFEVPGSLEVGGHLRAAQAAGLDAAAWPEILAPGSPLDEALRGAAAPPEGPWVEAARGRWTLRVDGGVPLQANAGLPGLVQLEGARGVAWTRDLAPGWVGLPAPPRRGLRVAAGVAGGSAVALWLAGVGTRAAWDAQGGERLVLANHGLLGAAAGAAGLASALTVAALVDAARARRAP